MPRPRSRNPKVVSKVRQQVVGITKAFAKQNITITTEYAADGGVSGMYAEGGLLVRDEFLERVQRILGQPVGLGNVKRVIAGVVLITLVQAAESPDVTVPLGETPTVQVAMGAVVELFGEGIAAPNYALTVAPVGPCPATEPQEVYEGTEPCPGICTENSGEGVLVYIADTGLLKDAEAEHPWLDDVQRALEPDGTIEDWDPDRQPDPVGGVPKIPPYSGHGTFVAGVVRCMAPEAEVIVSNAFKIAGTALEGDLVTELTQALTLGVDIFNLSITTTTTDTGPMLAFPAWLSLLRSTYKGVVCVAAAGNDGSRHPCWPAAFPEVVSVGALAANWRDRADFSNHGGWVDVYAPGRDLINAYATGPYRCQDDPYKDDIRNFYGMCQWSGTSFSTPIVTGLIAARMSRTGENGQEAAAALLAEARAQAIPGVGAILLPCGEDCDRPERRERRRCCCHADRCCCHAE